MLIRTANGWLKFRGPQIHEPTPTNPIKEAADLQREKRHAHVTVGRRMLEALWAKRPERSESSPSNPGMSGSSPKGS